MKPIMDKLQGFVRRGPRRKALNKRWSHKCKKVPLFKQFFHLPTRETLTYAEAQKLVDIDIDGELHRLNICLPLEIIHQKGDVAFDSSGEEILTRDSTPPTAQV